MKDDAVEAEISETQEDPTVPEIEQVAQATSRKLLILIGVAAALFIIMQATPLGAQIRDWETITEIVKAGGWKADLYFVLISSALILIGMPRLLFYALGGYAFGFWEGLVLSLIGSLLGSFITFRAARWGGRKWLTERFGHRRFFGRIVHAKPTIASVAFLRMLPVANVVINVGLALGKVRNRAFFLGSLIGFLPQGVVAVLIGSGMGEDVPAWMGATQIGLAGAILLAIFFYTSWHRSRRT